MNGQDILIDRFVDRSVSYFNIDLICECTGVDRDAVQERLNQLIADNVIRKISKYEDIYVTNRGRYAAKVSTIHCGNWTFDLKACQDICLMLELSRIKSVRQLAAKMQRSRQWAYLYLEALISVDAVGIRKSGYYTKDIGMVFKVGSVIKKGIIREKRAECGIQPKSRSKKTTQTTNPK
jgi:predicted transcriptional regulator